MKIKNFFQIFGLKRKPQHFTYKIIDYKVGEDDIIHYAQWNHPREQTKEISSDLIHNYAQYINKGDFCIDIGAHSGDTSLPMAVAAGKEGCVLALEPNPYIYHVLEKNIRANTAICHIKSIMAAAVDQEGFVQFEYSDSGFCNGGSHKGMSPFTHGHPYKLKVFGINLQDELKTNFSEYLPSLTFIKIDAEGYDLYVLKTLENTLSQFTPVVKAEVFQKTTEKYRKDMLSFFENLNYNVYKIKEDPLSIGEPLTLQNLECGKHYDILCIPIKP